jgi:copper transport protein
MIRRRWYAGNFTEGFADLRVVGYANRVEQRRWMCGIKDAGLRARVVLHSNSARVLCFVLLATCTSLFSPSSAGAHAELERSSPSADALLAAPPESFEFWFTEHVASDPAPEIKVLDETGRQLRMQSIHIDSSDTKHVTAEVAGVSNGTYTVIWTVTSADDGHSLTGTYGFRVGSGRAPGAATVEGENPRAWAVAMRWLTFFGAGIVAAALAWIAYAGSADPDRLARRRALIGVAACIVGLIATVLEPFLQTKFPSSGAEKPSLSEAVSGLPNAWWLRPAGLAIAAGAATILILVSGRRSQARILAVAGAAGGMIALMGLSLTTHVAAHDSWNALAKASVTVHEWSVGLWVGGLVVLVAAWPRGAISNDTLTRRDALRDFSAAALVLAPLGVTAGILNSALVLPTLDSLWESDYGRILIVKLLVLVPVVLLAARHRLWLRRHAVRIGTGLQASVRAEVAIAALVVLCGVILALSAPPIESKGELSTIDLAAPLPGNENVAELLHLIVGPVRAGENEIEVKVSLKDPANGGQILPVDLVRLNMISLNYEADQRGIEFAPNGEGDFKSSGVQLTLNGWWEIDVLVRRPGLEDVTVPFFLLVPDPNINGFGAPKAPDSSDEAKQLYDQALAHTTSLHSLHYTERLASGLGQVVTSDRVVSDGTDGNPPTSLLVGEQVQLLTIGDRTWQRTTGEDWFEREYIDVFPPSKWAENYEGATDFALGRKVKIGDSTARVVTFFVPGTDRLIAAWYTWWIDEESGQVVHETMVSRLHYMRWQYFDFNEPVVIPVPGSELATPVAATPVASPASE